tara:strand:- start:321 stop:971 length:651 start_codon:yes stop_codon:yes gene_type:complete
MSLSVLQRLKKKYIFKDPYPHIVIPNCLPSDLYSELESRFPEQCGPTSDDLLNEFLAYHESLEFFDSVVNAFGKRLNVCPASKFLDDRDKINPIAGVMITDADSYLTKAITAPHLDKKKKLYIANIYFRPKEDTFSGGQFVLYKASDNNNIQVEKIPGNPICSHVDFKEVKRVEYAANTLCLFVNTGHSIHSVTERGAKVGRRAIKFQGIVNRKIR